MKSYKALVILLCSLPVSLFALCDKTCKGRNNPDVLSTVPEIVKRHGYSIETFNVTTDDGYILSLFKVSKKDSKNKKKTVFVQHGIATNSGCWVDIGNRSLAFQLADKGYEVWLGNVRGTRYSQKHQKLSVSDPKYWNFTLDTVAEKDMSSQLKFVFKKSGQMMYIGHSMGTTLYLMYSSAFSSEAKKMIQASVLLAPVAYLNGNANIEIIKIPAYLLIQLLDTLKQRGFLYQNEIHYFLVEACCCTPQICKAAVNLVFGKTVQFSDEDVPLFMSFWPDGASIYQYKQYLQIADSARFQKYDYGSKANSKIYGTAKPPAYNLKNITVSIGLLYGENDSLYTKQNLERLYNELGSKNKYKHAIPSEGSAESFDHSDFLYSDKMQKNLYKRLFETLNQLEK